MEGTKRREHLVRLLMNSENPISGSQLSKLLGISRQVVVQDIALLRAADVKVISTTKGYVIDKSETASHCRVYRVNHDNSQIEDELCTVVDNGGKLLDVQINHPIYGEITTELIISNRVEVYEFVERVNQKNTTPLKELTNGEHTHKVEATSEEILDRIEQSLRLKGYLVEE